MKKIIVLSVILLEMTLFGCTEKQPKNNEKITIVTTLYPQYDFAKAIAGDKADVVFLLPPGGKTHSFEPSPKEIITINESDLFIYTGENMEGWAAKIIENIPKETKVVDVSKGIELTKNENSKAHGHEGEHQHENEEHHHHHDYDPHIWTNPVFVKTMVRNIQEGLVEKDPKNASYYKENADKYIEKLDELDQRFKTIVAEGKRKNIYFGGRFALAYFIAEYGLDAHSNCSEETEPSVQDMVIMINEMKVDGIPVVYFEELTDPKVAQTISDATGAQMLMFHTCHNVSLEDFQNGITYLEIMNRNAEHLKQGLQ